MHTHFLHSAAQGFTFLASWIRQEWVSGRGRAVIGCEESGIHGACPCIPGKRHSLWEPKGKGVGLLTMTHGGRRPETQRSHGCEPGNKPVPTQLFCLLEEDVKYAYTSCAPALTVNNKRSPENNCWEPELHKGPGQCDHYFSGECHPGRQWGTG